MALTFNKGNLIMGEFITKNNYEFKSKINRRIYLLLLTVIFSGQFLVISFSLVFLGIYFYHSKNLPEISSINFYNNWYTHLSNEYTVNGQKKSEYLKDNAIYVEIENMPSQLLQAFIATQDSRFYKHKGFDLLSAFRALRNNIKAGKIIQGGTTITQYVARLFLSKDKRIFQRKIREIIFAYKLEQHFDKDDILCLYMNQIYLGHGAYGVGVASLQYFNKSVMDLNLAECAILAGIAKAPEKYSPFDHFDYARSRQIHVLNQMVSKNYIYKEEAAEAIEFKLDIISQKSYPEKKAYNKTNFIIDSYKKDDSSASKIYVKLKCNHEGEIKNVYDIDKTIKIYSNCQTKQNKSTPLKYNEDLKFFIGHPECSSGTINIDSFKFKNKDIYFDQNNQKYVINLTFNKQTKDMKRNITSIERDSIYSNNYQVKLHCRHEGITKNAFEIDEDIKVYANCPNKSVALKYNEDLTFFTDQPQCQNGTINIVSYKFENQSLNFSQSNQQFVIDMAFNKPVLYVLINPSLHLKKGPFARNDRNFIKFKNQFRVMSDKLDNNQKYHY